MKGATRLIAAGAALLLGAGLILWQRRAMRPRSPSSRVMLESGMKTPAPGSAEPLDRPRRGLDVGFAAGRWSHWSGPQVEDPFGRGFLLPSPVPAPVPSAASVLKVSATWLQTGQRLAVVNGRLVGEGARLDGFRVERIEAGTVLVEGPSGLESLTVSPFGPPMPSTNRSTPVKPSEAGARRGSG